MKMRIVFTNLLVILTITTFTISFSGCKKDACESKVCLNGSSCINGSCNCPSGFSGINCQNDNRAACEINNTGNIVFDSYSSNPYNCYVNSIYKGRVSGNGTLTVSMSPGYCSIKTTQVSGYVLYPSEYTGSGTLSKCGSLTFSFP